MSIGIEGASVPQWDMADRLTKSLRIARVTNKEMAEYLEVHRNTVSAWVSGTSVPTRPILIAWALRTGVPFEWLRDGTEPPTAPGPDGDPTPAPVGPRPTKRRNSDYNSGACGSSVGHLRRVA